MLRKSSNDQLPSVSGSIKHSSSASSSSTTNIPAKTPWSVTSHSKISSSPIPVHKYLSNPSLPHDKDIRPVPSTIMYWSHAPVWGSIPTQTMRAHTVTLVDTTAWIFGILDPKHRQGT